MKQLHSESNKVKAFCTKWPRTGLICRTRASSKEVILKNYVHLIEVLDCGKCKHRMFCLFSPYDATTVFDPIRHPESS